MIDESVSRTDEQITNQDSQQYLTFQLDNEFYGIPVVEAKEVIEFKKITRIPYVPAYIRGIINLRGDVVPVIDLPSLFFDRHYDRKSLSYTIIVERSDENDDFSIGLMIDSINTVIDIAPGQIESTPEFGTRMKPDYLNGVGKVDDLFIILLNIDKILDMKELSNFDEYGSANAGRQEPELPQQ